MFNMSISSSISILIVSMLYIMFDIDYMYSHHLGALDQREELGVG